MPTILGVDISKSSVSCCVISERPVEVRSFYFDCEFYKFFANASGISALLALIPPGAEVIAVMEPTAVNYQKLWGTHLARSGVEVRLVGHKELRNFREGFLGLPDKDDDADALALAIYGWDYFNLPAKFLQIRSCCDRRNSPPGTATGPSKPRAVANYQPFETGFSVAVSRSCISAIASV